MPHPTVVINVVGLTESLIGDWSPHLQAFARENTLRTLKPAFPAVTTTVQSSMLTGVSPREHGIVGNGWYNREYNEIHFWKQSNALVKSEKVWETARQRDPSVTCANMFWWYNMYSSVNWSVTPRPIYKADGRKIPDVYSEPPDLRSILQERLGRFPLFNFWGPRAGIASSRWIAEASMIVEELHSPTLMLIYLPHLDYDLQRFGPDGEEAKQAVTEIDEIIGDLITFYRSRGRGTRLMIVSEYGIEPVNDAIHINRLLREDRALRVREEDGLELLDPGASDAFAIVDHQIAHVYVRDQANVERYAAFLQNATGVERALTRQDQASLGINHERSGDIILIAEPGKWFSYDYWLEDSKAPDFARTVDIHRKPGYDPLELFIDPAIRAPRLKLAGKLLQMKAGFRTLMDVIPLNTSLVRGSHGRVDQARPHRPVLIAAPPLAKNDAELASSAVHDVMLSHLFDSI
ncbi:MAG TPA: alkaline phosphatase family protein [Phycisphaerales bacterium]|nr:alkaline phosphatase family protein [Phycisphaerales bacterium]HRQ76273.1 alkaline phosphatase family protein [Phycisphaerales bacterium]